MIESLMGLPDGVTGIRVSGQISAEELHAFWTSDWEELVQAEEIRFVEVIEDDYAGFGPGGLMEDWKLSWGGFFHHYSAFKRIAVVTDKQWIVHAVHALAWMVPGEIKMFGLNQFDQAAEWAAAD